MAHTHELVLPKACFRPEVVECLKVGTRMGFLVSSSNPRMPGRMVWFVVKDLHTKGQVILHNYDLLGDTWISLLLKGVLDKDGNLPRNPIPLKVELENAKPKRY